MVTGNKQSCLFLSQKGLELQQGATGNQQNMEIKQAESYQRKRDSLDENISDVQ